MNVQYVEMKVEEAIAFITINRPKAMNALNTGVLDELTDIVVDLSARTDVKAAILTGAGERAFAAGADIEEMRDKTPLEARSFSEKGHRLMSGIEQLNQPVIAAVNGFALGGGCELALSCDIRVASANAMFGQPEVSLGIIPGFGGSQRLPRLVGPSIAKELLMSGVMITAERAYEIGLVNYVVESHTELYEKARQLAQKIISRSSVGVQRTKQLVNHGMNMELEKAISYETEMFANMFATEDQKEGMDAFLNKREPKFTGK